MEDLKQQYESKGYIVASDVFTQEEIRSMKAEIKALLNKKGVFSRENDASNGVFVGLSANSDLFKKIAADRRIINVLQNVIGKQIVFLSDKVVFKNATTDFGSPWHQDWPYWKGSHKLSVWVALDDATIKNGCLKVILGSHLRGELLHRGEVHDNFGFINRMNPDDIDDATVVSLPIKAGGAVFFHDLLLHASHPNVSGEDRWALISTYKDGTQPDPSYDWAVASFPIICE
ncbi:phytanoyl-CoA dioxygenase family protein [Alicyclobacillus fodiniaquatilis]|uniref:Phytanoyl-CoA dioxygenase family protein n=1 Tax=Alicyclobacillus fodiniaquatilis TaxID=1661150 RepID=A0ABW4JHZ4_9BACL